MEFTHFHKFIEFLCVFINSLHMLLDISTAMELISNTSDVLGLTITKT